MRRDRLRWWSIRSGEGGKGDTPWHVHSGGMRLRAMQNQLAARVDMAPSVSDGIGDSVVVS